MVRVHGPALAVIAILLLVLPGMAQSRADVPPVESGQAPAGFTFDGAWLTATYDEHAHHPGFIDVAFVTEPTLHVAMLFDRVVPPGPWDLHPDLETVAYAVEATPLTHEPIVPIMRLLAQGHEPGIRPGAWMEAPHACTMSFVMRDAAGALYIMTAGHCTEYVGQPVSLVGLGRIGEVAARRYAGVGEDYAIVRIDPEHYPDVNPSTVGWGGPTGTATSAAVGDGVKHYGWGSLTWYTHESRCRAASGPMAWGTKVAGFAGVSAWGDSGSEFMLGDGQAAGIITHLSTSPWQGTVLGTRQTYAVDRLEARLGTELTLVEGGPVSALCSG